MKKDMISSDYDEDNYEDIITEIILESYLNQADGYRKINEDAIFSNLIKKKKILQQCQIQDNLGTN